MVPAEGLCELRGLAIADAGGDVPHAQRCGAEHLGSACHADLCEMGAECGLADLAVRPLQLAAGCRDATGDVVQLEIAIVFSFDNGYGITQERATQTDGDGSMGRHDRYYAPNPKMDAYAPKVSVKRPFPYVLNGTIPPEA